MAIPNKEIGWSQESNLLWQIAKQITRLTSVMFSLKPKYKVFTAFISQTGGDGFNSTSIGTNYGSTLTIGVSYTIASNDTTDFTNVGAPNNNVGTSFIATGEIPANQNSNDNTNVTYNTGAPIIVILENTIGNIWLEYRGIGNYSFLSNNLFPINKTFVNGTSFFTNPVFNRLIKDDGTGFDVQAGYMFQYLAISKIRLATLSDAEVFNDDVISSPICVEIRVYN